MIPRLREEPTRVSCRLPSPVLALLALAVGCGGAEPGGGCGCGGGPGDPGFKILVLDPAAITIAAGGDKPLFVAVQALNGEA